MKNSGVRNNTAALCCYSATTRNSSEHDLLDAIEMVQNTGALIYCICYTPKEHCQLTARTRYGIRVMQHLSSLTGVADLDALATDLPTVFTQIGDELRARFQMLRLKQQPRAGRLIQKSHRTLQNNQVPSCAPRADTMPGRQLSGQHSFIAEASPQTKVRSDLDFR